MKILLTEKEMRNVVASRSVEEVKRDSKGEFRKWDVQLTEEGYTLEYIFDEKGNYKEKFKKEFE